RAVRTRHAPELDELGPSGRRQLFSDMGYVSPAQPGGGRVTAAGTLTLRSTRRHQVHYPLVHLAGAFRVERLDAHVIGAGGEMGVDPRADRFLIAPGDDRVDEAVGAAAGKVALPEAEPAPAIDVVLEQHVGRERGARAAAGAGRVGLEQHHLLDAQKLAGAEN